MVDILLLSYPMAMWEEGMNTKPQIYYNNKHEGTHHTVTTGKQTKKDKSDEDNMYIVI